MCQRRRLMYWLLEGVRGSDFSRALGCVPACQLGFFGLGRCRGVCEVRWGLVWSDGSSVEISITQAYDKWTCSRKFARLFSGRPGNPLWRHAASRPLSMWACHSHVHMRKVQHVKWLRKTCATLAQGNSLLWPNMQSLFRANWSLQELGRGFWAGASC